MTVKGSLMPKRFALRAAGIARPIRVLYPVPAAFAPTAAAQRIGLAVGEPGRPCR